MNSHAHISQTSEHLSLSLVLLNIFAEGTVATLHVGKLILVLNKEAAAVLAHADGHVGNHVLEVPFRQVCAEVRHVLDKDLFEAHRLHDISTDANWLVILWRNLVLCVLEEALREQIVFETLVVVVHRKDLLLLAH